MTLTFLLLTVIFGLWLIFLKKRQLNGVFGRDNKLVKALKNAKWFQNYCFSGSVIFVINAVLFFLTCLLLYFLTNFVIPFIHILVMIGAVVGSIYLWFIFNHAWEGTKRNRMKMGAIGSSFYFILSLIFIYWFVTLEPIYPGEDIFMRSLGLMFAFIVTTTAFYTCFFITGFSSNNNTA